MIEIPTFPATPSYSLTITLDGEDFIILIDYNEREDAYFMGLQTSDGEDILRGKKIVPNIPLLRFLAADIRPAGDILAIDQERTDMSPRLGELGDRVLLYYLEAADVAAL